MKEENDMEISGFKFWVEAMVMKEKEQRTRTKRLSEMRDILMMKTGDC